MAKSPRNTDAVWHEVDPATLQPAAAAAYKAYKDQYAKAKELKAKFEQVMSDAAELPASHRLIFGYNFGKLSVAIVDAVAATVSKKAVDFATLIKKAA